MVTMCNIFTCKCQSYYINFSPQILLMSENRWKKKRHIMRSVNTLLSLSRIWGCSLPRHLFKDRLLLNSAITPPIHLKMCLFWITLSMKSFFNAATFQTTVVSLDRSQLMACLVWRNRWRLHYGFKWPPFSPLVWHFRVLSLPQG